MKNLLKSVATLFFFLPELAYPQTYFFAENYNAVERSEEGGTTVTPVLDLWSQWQFKGEEDESSRLGTFLWMQFIPQNDGYRQFYVGPSYHVTSWLQVGVGGGVERTDGNMGRFGSFAYLSKDRHSVFSIYENGGSGPWWLVLHSTRFGPKSRYELGVVNQAYIGTGPRFAVNLGQKQRWKLWSSAHFEQWGVPNFQFGIRWVYADE